MQPRQAILLVIRPRLSLGLQFLLSNLKLNVPESTVKFYEYGREEARSSIGRRMP